MTPHPRPSALRQPPPSGPIGGGPIGGGPAIGRSYLGRLIILASVLGAAVACSADNDRPGRGAPDGVPTATTTSPAGGTDTAASPTDSPASTPSNVPVGSHLPAPSGSGGTTPELARYLAALPKFEPAPTPIPVALPHAAGRAAWVSRIPTTQPVAFLTIDDGIVRSPAALALLDAADVPVTLFLTTDTVSPAPDYFRRLQAMGAVIENHTVSHPSLVNLGYDGQKREFCQASDRLEAWFGRRPSLFRPPYGTWNDTTLRAAWDCGLRAGFYWKETVDKGKVRYQTALRTVQPGDIILMHFRPAFADDFVAALRAIHAAGLTPALLEDYVLVT